MSTTKETISVILKKLGNSTRFTARPLFGEYAVYADQKVVALVCDDLLYVKICAASSALEHECEQDAPYPGARPYYVVDEEKLDSMQRLPHILCAIAETLPAKTARRRKK
jgi:TfoX/Sxy family transcriptional regulator of competence genes